MGAYEQHLVKALDQLRLYINRNTDSIKDLKAENTRLESNNQALNRSMEIINDQYVFDELSKVVASNSALIEANVEQIEASEYSIEENMRKIMYIRSSICPHVKTEHAGHDPHTNTEERRCCICGKEGRSV